MEIKNQKIGIVGAGIMGIGVAQRFALHGYEIVLIDLTDEILKKAVNQISRNFHMEKMMGKIDINVDEIMNLIGRSISYESINDADFVIENVTENEQIKKEVYEKLETTCNDKCKYLVNTSCISITKIGSFTKRAENVLGVHFMNPVPMQNFAEVIKGTYTNDDTISTVSKLLGSVGMECTIVNDSPGFVSNRLSHLFMNEAAYMVFEGVADAEQVDMIFKEGFHHKMGPLETADLIGLDTVLQSLNVLYESYQDSKFRACPLLKRMVDANMLGRKSGKGFYEY